MKLLCLLLTALAAAASAAGAAEYALDNGYIALRGSGGVVRDVRVDPTGSGNYGPTLLREVYAGELPEPADTPHRVNDNTVIVNNVRVYSNPREVGQIRHDTAVRLERDATLGQLFSVETNGMAAVSAYLATWNSRVSAATITLRAAGPDGPMVAQRRFENVLDNSWVTLLFPAVDKGTYYVEMSDPRGPIGWWTSLAGPKAGIMYENGAPVDLGSRAFRAKVFDVFPARVRISLVGPKLFAEAEPDEPRRSFVWKASAPFVRDGFEVRDPKQVAFRRFYTDTGQYMPAAQLKRRDSGLAMKASKWVHASGNAGADAQFALDDGRLEWEIESDSLTLRLGRDFAMTVLPASDRVPEYYPEFYSSDRMFDHALNTFFYDRAFTWPVEGLNPDWFEWMALIHFWNYRPGCLEYWRERLLTCRMGDDGYVYTWGDNIGWPFPDNEQYDTRHFTTNPNLILATYRYYAWTKDRRFLMDNAARVRAAMRFMLEELKGSQGIIVLPDKDHGGTPDDVASNYWDNLPFGGQSAYENAYFYASLGAMASVETALGNLDAARVYNDLRAKCREQYNRLFWNDQAGRYVGCIDRNGVTRDYGFTFVNMEAAAYGLADTAQVRRIYRWMESEKTASGKLDTYSRFRFAPRVNTIDCSEWWYLNGQGEIPAQPFDTHLENGGAILYTSGYDIMARARYLGADNAFRRLREILDRYQEPDALCGGAPLRYGEVNGWQVGTDVPFPESGLAPASFLHAFLGIQATAEGLSITPNLPSALRFAGVRNLRYRGLMLDVRVTPTSVRIRCEDPGHFIDVERTISPGDTFLFTDLES